MVHGMDNVPTTNVSKKNIRRRIVNSWSAFLATYVHARLQMSFSGI